MVEIDWIKHRWLEFRTGYGTYLTFFFAFSNFLLIAYQFLPQLKDMIPFPYFAAAFGAIIIPTAIYVGHHHNKNQLPADSKVAADFSPYKEKIQPNSKEELGNKFNLFNIAMTIWNQKLNIFSQKVTIFNQELNEFNIGHTQWLLEGTIWNYTKTIKEMKMHNMILDKLNIEGPRYDKEFKEAEIIISEAKERHAYLTDRLKELKDFKPIHFENLKGLQSWNDVLLKWNEVYEKLQRGILVSNITDVPE